jgi:hypothetical protein
MPIPTNIASLTVVTSLQLFADGYCAMVHFLYMSLYYNKVRMWGADISHSVPIPMLE